VCNEGEAVKEEGLNVEGDCEKANEEELNVEEEGSKAEARLFNGMDTLPLDGVTGLFGLVCVAPT